MNQPKPPEDGYQTRTRTSLLRLFLWDGAWGSIAELDQLQRKVQLNSMGITLGVALIAGVPISVMDSYHVIPIHADIAYLPILLSLTFAVSNLYGTRRYR